MMGRLWAHKCFEDQHHSVVADGRGLRGSCLMPPSKVAAAPSPVQVASWCGFWRPASGRYTVGEGCCVPLLRNRVGARGPELELWSEKGSLHPGLVDLVSSASQVLLMGRTMNR